MAHVASSDLDWTITRPAFTDGPSLSGARAIDASTRERANQIARTGLAAWLVDQIASPTYIYRTVSL